jgi:ParB-like chromosome segregation protein Spo0J
MHGGMAPANTLAIAKIKVGVRHRRDMGDLAGLSASIAENGLLHPIVITPHRELIAGERRLKACAALGWTKVPITVVDLDEIARGERDENFVRKDFTPSEAVAIAEALAPKIKAEAKARQAAAGPSTGRGAKPNGGGNLPQAVKGKARDKAADFTGIAARTLAKAAAVVQALRADPKNERIQKLHADMDRTGNVTARSSG